MDQNKCRLCLGDLDFSFKEIILDKFNIDFFKCSRCGSLQTEKPYWLEEAYEAWNTEFDTGLFARCYNNFLVVFLICKLTKFKNVLDYGGGDGLFTRIMRDYKINCYNYDKHSETIYSKKFNIPDFNKPDLVTSFEAIEHFADPMTEFEKIFQNTPEMIILTTKIYENQNKDWDYFEFQTGQHIFFYTKNAFKYLAKKFNYNLVFLELGYILFYSNKYSKRKLLLYMLKNFFIRKKFMSFLDLFKIFFKKDGYENDYKIIKEK